MAQILSEYLQQQAATPFQWNTADCFTFVAGWLDQVTGYNALARWRGLYSDALSASRFIDANGGYVAIAGAFFASHYGAQPCRIGQGIAVLVQTDRRRMMGLRIDRNFIALRGPRGIMMRRSPRVLAEWDLPCPKH